MRRSSVCLYLMLSMAACEGFQCYCPSSSEDEGVGVIEGLDTSEKGITAFVKEGRYKSWLTQSEPTSSSEVLHPSKVRVFFNPIVAASLRAGGNEPHPKGSIIVMEGYEDTGGLTDHAVSVKIEEGGGEETWIFYLGYAPDYESVYYARGHITCSTCHVEGRDYVKSQLPAP